MRRQSRPLAGRSDRCASAVASVMMLTCPVSGHLELERNGPQISLTSWTCAEVGRLGCTDMSLLPRKMCSALANRFTSCKGLDVDGSRRQGRDSAGNCSHSGLVISRAQKRGAEAVRKTPTGCSNTSRNLIDQPWAC
jgi:hypothetical protein